MSELTELKPCPFCGGKPHMAHGIDGAVTGIMCHKCKAFVMFTPERFKLGRNEQFGEQMNRWAEAWNRREDG